MIHELIAKAAGRVDLAEDEMASAMEEISEGRATSAQIGALLVALLMKGETEAEIAGAVRVLREKALTVPVRPNGRPLVDVVGTGGDGRGTFNVSTTTAFVVSACGVRVAKHGNRSVSSSCGAADVLEALGVNLDLPPALAAECVESVGLGFLFAPLLHPAMRHAVPPRKEIRLKSIFNLIGPLTNPAGASHLLLGVYREDLVGVMAGVLKRLGCPGAMVVRGDDGCDEITITGPTKVARLRRGRVTVERIEPRDFGFLEAPLEAVQGGSADVNAAITRRVLEGRPGPCRDMVLLNAAAALTAAEAADNMTHGVRMAAQAVDSGRALARLDQLIDFTRRAAEGVAVGA